jgi:hypothetical protein
MVMTDDGPVSMCEHNARRDEFILRPIPLRSTGPDGACFEPARRPGSGRAGRVEIAPDLR